MWYQSKIVRIFDNLIVDDYNKHRCESTAATENKLLQICLFQTRMNMLMNRIFLFTEFLFCRHFLIGRHVIMIRGRQVLDCAMVSSLQSHDCC